MKNFERITVDPTQMEESSAHDTCEFLSPRSCVYWRAALWSVKFLSEFADLQTENIRVPAVRWGRGNGVGTAPFPLRLKFLIDNTLPPPVVDLVVTAGHDAVHVRAYRMHAVKGEEIFARAWRRTVSWS